MNQQPNILQTFMFSALLMAGGLMSQSVQAETLTFSANVTSSATCTITPSPASPLKMEDIDGNEMIGKAYPVSGRTPFTWTFTNCPKVGSSPAPFVTATAALAPNNGNNPWIAKDVANSTSQGYGISIEVRADGLFSPNDLIDFASGALGNNAPSLPNPIPDNTQMNFWAVVSCGAVNYCTEQNLRPGTLSAVVTFNFTYK